MTFYNLPILLLIKKQLAGMELFQDFANYSDGWFLIYFSGANFLDPKVFAAGSFGEGFQLRR